MEAIVSTFDRLLFHFLVEDVVPKKLRLEYKICHSTPVCITLCHVFIIYVYFTSL
jgi:hypothetical protein